MSSKLNHRVFLRQELDRRIALNSRYSLRAFAKFLGLDPGYLSNVMSGKRYLSIASTQKIVAALQLNDTEAQLIFKSAAERVDAKTKGNTPTPKELDSDTYAVISDMLHYLILESTYLDDFKSEPRWIARRLGVTVIEIEAAIARLIRLGLIECVGGRFRKSDRYLTTKNKSQTTPALKASQRQILRSALNSLESDPLELRASFGGTMAIDPEKLPIAKQMIAEFIDSLIHLLESGKRKEVYQVGVNLFSLERNLSPNR